MSTRNITHLSRRLFAMAAAVTLALCALLAISASFLNGGTPIANAQGGGETIITHTLTSDFDVCTVLTGTLNRSYTGTILSDAGGGEIRLASLFEEYFTGAQVDASKWITSEPNFESDVTLSNGQATITNAGLRSILAVPAPGRILEIRARLQPRPTDPGFAGIGLGREDGIGAPGSGCPGDPDCDGGSREFIKDTVPDLFAVAWDGYTLTDVVEIRVPGVMVSETHLYRIEWDANQTRYYVDHALIPSATFTSSLVYTPYVWLTSLASYTVIEIDWVRVYSYPASAGQYVSCAVDTQQTSGWTTISWTNDLPTGTAASFETRSSLNGATWSAWAPVSGPGSAIPSPNGRYLQYRIHLTTTNANASPEIQSVHIGYAPNQAPIANAGGPYTVNEGALATFNGGASSDPNNDPLLYSWDLDNNGVFGDAAGVTATRTYTDGPSTRFVGLRVTDESGLTSTQVTTVTIANVKPAVNTPNLSASPSSEGSPVTASATFSDPGGNDAPFTCAVNYGDGTGNLTGAIVASTCTGPAHVYADNGTYTVTVTVADKDGAGGAGARQHTVNNVAPSAATTGPYSGMFGAPIAFTGSYTDPGSADTHTFLWNFGDGVTSTLQSPSHAYASAGVFTATFKVTDKDGGVGMATTTVNVRFATYLPAILRNAGGAARSGTADGAAELAAWIERAVVSLLSN